MSNTLLPLLFCSQHSALCSAPPQPDYGSQNKKEAKDSNTPRDYAQSLFEALQPQRKSSAFRTSVMLGPVPQRSMCPAPALRTGSSTQTNSTPSLFLSLCLWTYVGATQAKICQYRGIHARFFIRLTPRTLRSLALFCLLCFRGHLHIQHRSRALSFPLTEIFHGTQHHGSLLCFRFLGHLHIRRDGVRHPSSRRSNGQEVGVRQRGHNAHECIACTDDRPTHGGRVEGDGAVLPGRRVLGRDRVHPFEPAQVQEEGARDATCHRGRRPDDYGRLVELGREGRAREARRGRRPRVLDQRRHGLHPVPDRLLRGGQQEAEGRVGLQREHAVEARQARLQEGVKGAPPVLRTFLWGRGQDDFAASESPTGLHPYFRSNRETAVFPHVSGSRAGPVVRLVGCCELSRRMPWGVLKRDGWGAG